MIGVTGASGFVGAAVYEAIENNGSNVTPLLRQYNRCWPSARVVGDFGPKTPWADAVQGLACIVHCAAHVHQMHTADTNSSSDFVRVNTLGSLRLAEEASKVGVKRLVFISSVKAMGEQTAPKSPFKFNDAPCPLDPYGQSKWEAEQGLWEIASRTGLEVVIIRPPLVYGPGVGANFRQLMQWVSKGIPLPIGAVHNKRSLVALPNLIDLIATCIKHPAAPGNTFLVSDGQDLSTSELVHALAKAMGRAPRIFPFPPTLLKMSAALVGRSDSITRLTQSLQVDISHTQQVLGWSPVCTVEQGMQMTVKEFLGR